MTDSELTYQEFFQKQHPQALEHERVLESICEERY